MIALPSIVARFVLSWPARGAHRPYDLQIAAIARSAGLCVVTCNVSEFSRVPALMIENWQDVQ
jgi:tRNA(fMet)-specific endonuclease VapC